MFKKKIGLFICIIIFMIPMSTASSQWPLTILCDGSPLASDTLPEIINSHTYVPIGAIASATGARAFWDDNGKCLTIEKDDTSLKMFIGSTYMEHNGNSFTTDLAPFIRNDRVMVPLRLLSEILGYEVEWDALTSTVSISQPKNVFYRISQDCVDVFAKYSLTQDIMFRIERRGPNSIPDFSQIYLVYNTEANVQTDTTDGFLFYTSYTDWHSPFIITADENADGDNQDELHFTGGNHGYNNDQEGSPTASLQNLSYNCDGAAAESSYGFCRNFEIVWTNNVQASNTKKVDGTGREVMQEVHSLIFDGKTWYSKVTLKPLEAITIYKVYGFQADITGVWDDFVEYSNSKLNMTFPAVRENSSGEADTSSVTCSKGLNLLTISLDTSYGLGTRDYCADADGIFLSSYNKIYFNLVNGVPLKATPENEYSYKGTYCFYSSR